MANQYFRKGRGRPVSVKYERRVNAVGRETIRLRTEARRVLKKALQEATQEQLYDRTPLPVSRDMYNSITTHTPKGNVIEVGYFKGRGAKHAPYRVNMKGISPSGGHQLDMNPGAAVAEKADPPIKRHTRAAQKRIIGD